MGRLREEDKGKGPVLAADPRESGFSTQTWISATFILVFTTLLSKALGLLRDVLVASYFGASPQVDAFMVAVTLATLVGGTGFALSAALIPAYRRALAAEGPHGASRLAGGAIGLTLLLSLSLIFVLVIAPRPLVRMVAPALPEATAALAVEMIWWLSGLMLGLNLIYIFGAVYNALEHFKIPAYMDLASNVCVLLALVFLSGRLGIRALALGLGVGTLLVVAAIAIPLFRRGVVSFNVGFRIAGVRHIAVLAAPVFLWELLSQATGIVENAFGSTLEAGSIAVLGYAKRLSVLAVTLVAVNIARAVFPVLSRLISEHRLGEAKDLFVKLSRQYMLVFVPMSVALMYFRQEIVTVVFMRGAFDAEAAGKTSAVLLFYAAGVVPMVAIPVCIRACYAFSDTVTPLVASGAGLVALGALNYVLVPSFGVKGIAVSTTLALVPSVAIMAGVLGRRLGGLDVQELSKVGVLATACSVAALVPVAALQAQLLERPDGLVGLTIGLGIYFVTYVTLGWYAMGKEVRALWVLLRRGS
jgi:putative peptidoglycan lipid II flippase